MVIDQGTLLDSVEYNIEQTAVQVSQAVKELDVATKCVFTDVIFTSSLIMRLVPRFCRVQVPEKYWEEELYIPPFTYHFRIDHRPHLQTPTSFLFHCDAPAAFIR